MPLAPIEDGEISYEIHGNGPPLLLVPGLGGMGAYWRPQIERYSQHYRVITYDHRGCGRSTRSETAYSVDQMSQDLLQLMDHLKLDSAHLVGHSTGGAIGQTIAIDQPDRLHSLVLYASWTRTDPFMRRVMETRKRLLESAGVEAYIRATPVFLYPNWWLNREKDKLAALDAATLASFPSAAIAASRCQAVIDFDRVDDLGRIKAPTLVVCAKDDFLTPLYFSEELARRIPHARLAILDGGAHAASQVCPEPFDEAVLGFLNAVRTE
jgi:aminoacrylate hydrolase